MTATERDTFLAAERTCRVATVSGGGRPHVSPLWFVWDGESLWLYSMVRSQRWTDLQRDPRLAVVVDAGVEYSALRGVELSGTVEVVGPIPRTGGEPGPELEEPERLFALKYGGGELVHDGRHGWLRLRPEREYSWDFRKLAGL